MSEKGADKAGIILARCLGVAAIIVSMSGLAWAVSQIIRWW